MAKNETRPPALVRKGANYARVPAGRYQAALSRIAQAQAIHEKLGGTGIIDDPVFKPKGMHWRPTFDKSNDCGRRNPERFRRGS